MRLQTNKLKHSNGMHLNFVISFQGRIGLSSVDTMSDCHGGDLPPSHSPPEHPPTRIALEATRPPRNQS